MNPILELKGRFKTRKIQAKGGGFKFPHGMSLKISHLRELAEQLQGVWSCWQKDTSIGGALISVYYNQVVPKSHRIQQLLSSKQVDVQDTVRGAKFVTLENERDGQAHVFTHFVPVDVLLTSAAELETVAEAFENINVDVLLAENAEERIEEAVTNNPKGVTSNKVKRIVHDALYVARFKIDHSSLPVKDDAIVTIYRTDIETKRLLSRYGITISDDRILNGTTLKLHQNELRQLLDKAPYLVSMQLTDLREIPPEEEEENDAADDEGLIPPPMNEPTIGVIDTQFNPSVYFSAWVDYRNMLSPDIEIFPDDRFHGTAVDSIIVDGPRGNPRLQDHCGRFRVRHFGVATNRGFSSFDILKKICQIVEDNRDIHVWNLSLGSNLEVNENFISPEGAILDDLQRKYDVIFVVAGTNVPRGIHRTDMRVGAPADSLNSVVVNSVGFDQKPASYSRTGPVLSFFNKPDVSYYGGDGSTMDERMTVCCDLGARSVVGTSFAAPWIARKLAYLIDVLGYKRELAKALLIEAAAGWNLPTDRNRMGFGIVPVSIHDIAHSKDDEIRFVMTALADEYETYTYELPVPIVKGAYPYHARVTLAYFPYCDQSQGVDYTGTEMDVKFGRVDQKGGVKAIDENKQGEGGIQANRENNARTFYRKWDNIKHVVEKIKDKSRPRTIINPRSGLWGLRVTTKDRKANKTRDKIPFGVVVTLRAMDGKNRLDDFIRSCETLGWIVNRIDVQSRLDVYTAAEADVNLE